MFGLWLKSIVFVLLLTPFSFADDENFNIDYWKKRTEFWLNFRKFSELRSNVIVWKKDINRDYGIYLQLTEDPISQRLECDINIFNGREVISHRLSIVSKVSFFTWQSLIEELIRIEEFKDAFKHMHEVKNGEYEKRIIYAYKAERKKYLSEVLKDFQKELVALKQRKTVSKLEIQDHLIEYMARTFVSFLECRRDLNVVSALRGLRISLKETIQIGPEILEQNDTLVHALKRFLKENDLYRSPQNTFLNLKEIFKREIFHR